MCYDACDVAKKLTQARWETVSPLVVPPNACTHIIIRADFSYFAAQIVCEKKAQPILIYALPQSHAFRKSDLRETLEVLTVH